jgi:hypothetical protein
LETIDNCNPNNTDWANETIITVLEAAKAGIPSAIKEKAKREKELGLPIIDTVSGKASGPSAIIEWIEE